MQTLTLSAPSIDSGISATLTWTSVYATNCAASGKRQRTFRQLERDGGDQRQRSADADRGGQSKLYLDLHERVRYDRGWNREPAGLLGNTTTAGPRLTLGGSRRRELKDQPGVVLDERDELHRVRHYSLTAARRSRRRP